MLYICILYLRSGPVWDVFLFFCRFHKNQTGMIFFVVKGYYFFIPIFLIFDQAQYEMYFSSGSCTNIHLCNRLFSTCTGKILSNKPTGGCNSCRHPHLILSFSVSLQAAGANSLKMNKHLLNLKLSPQANYKNSLKKNYVFSL